MKKTLADEIYERMLEDEGNLLQETIMAYVEEHGAQPKPRRAKKEEPAAEPTKEGQPDPGPAQAQEDEDAS